MAGGWLGVWLEVWLGVWCGEWRGGWRGSGAPMCRRAHRPRLLCPAQNPDLAAWRGASAFAAGPGYARAALTRAEYMEQGSARVRAEYEKHPTRAPKGRLW